jgi:hypothetical protein
MYALRQKVAPDNHGNVFLVPLGDWHVGAEEFDKKSEKRLDDDIDYIINTEGAYTFLMGDLMNSAVLSAPGKPSEEKFGSSEQFLYVVDKLKKLAGTGKILGSIIGNHEEQLVKATGSILNRTLEVCKLLDIEYCGLDCFLFFNILMPRTTANRTYYIYFLHGYGGGRREGGKLNNVMELLRICDFDLAVFGHVHSKIGTVTSRWRPNNGELVESKIGYVTCGSYLSQGSSNIPSHFYGTKKGYSPISLGAPRVWFEADQHFPKDMTITV